MEKHAREREAVQRAVLEAAGAPAELPESWEQALELTRLGTEALDDPSFGLRLVRGRVPQDGTGNT